MEERQHKSKTVHLRNLTPFVLSVQYIIKQATNQSD